MADVLILLTMMGLSAGLGGLAVHLHARRRQRPIDEARRELESRPAPVQLELALWAAYGKYRHTTGRHIAVVKFEFVPLPKHGEDAYRLNVRVEHEQ